MRDWLRPEPVLRAIVIVLVVGYAYGAGFVIGRVSARMGLNAREAPCFDCGSMEGEDCRSINGDRMVNGQHIARWQCAEWLDMNTTKKPGRPLRSTKPSLERIEIRITAAERKAWEKAAGDLSLSEWIRQRCNR